MSFRKDDSSSTSSYVDSGTKSLVSFTFWAQNSLRARAGTRGTRVHRTHSLPHVVTRHGHEYWVGISCHAATAVLFLIVALHVQFHALMGCALISSKEGMVSYLVGPGAIYGIRWVSDKSTTYVGGDFYPRTVISTS
jgi:hypothetical protein